MTYRLFITVYGCKKTLSVWDEIKIADDLIERLDADKEQEPDFDYVEEDDDEQ